MRFKSRSIKIYKSCCANQAMEKSGFSNLSSEESIKSEKVSQEYILELLTSQEVSWQAIIYELINTEQLDPWNIDLALLSTRYLEKIKELEEANFLISSKVLLAASILLRIKSEILLYQHLKSIDEILFGKKDEKQKKDERIVIDSNELPFLYPKTPLPRYKKVSLDELMSALNKAINTEMRRIKKEVSKTRLERDNEIVLPKSRINIKDRIRKIYSKILTTFKARQTKISYSELVGNDKEEKIACFLPILHLDNQQRLFLEQETHFADLWIWLYHHYKKINADKVDLLKEEIEEKKEEIHQAAGFDNPLANFFDGI